MSDIYCYPNTNILKNKLNIKDSEELFETEIELTSARLYELQKKPIKGKFDFKHLCKIHKYIFQDLYDWAGKPRTVNIAKGSMFCLVEYMQGYSQTIFPAYNDDCTNTKNNKGQFVEKLTEHYADLNALHPFREGNGRAQREFARELCLTHGYMFDLTQTQHQDMLDASVASLAKGDNSKLLEIFKTHITPLQDYQHKKQETLYILSKDDIPEQNIIPGTNKRTPTKTHRPKPDIQKPAPKPQPITVSPELTANKPNTPPTNTQNTPPRIHKTNDRADLWLAQLDPGLRKAIEDAENKKNKNTEPGYGDD